MSSKGTGPEASGGDRLSHRQRFVALLLLCTAQLMAILDISIVNIAIPTIQKELGLDTAALQWIVTAYVLTFGGFLLVGGRLGDLYGRRRMLLTGLALFTGASALGGLSADLTMLLAARAGQGLGGAIITPTVVSFITGLFREGPERNKALGLLGAVTGAGFALGLVLGGLLTSTVGWRWVFFINLPIGIAVAVGAVLLLPVTRLAGRHVNVISALLATSGLALAVYVLAGMNENTLPTTLVSALVAVVLLYAFVVAEGRSAHPLIPTGLLRHGSLARAVIGSTTFGAVVAPTTFILTLYLQNVSNMDPLTTGLAFLPQEGTVFLAANLAGGFVTRHGTRRVLAASIGVLALGAVVHAQLPVGGGYTGVVLPGLLIFGFGLGALNVAGSISATEGVPRAQHGIAAGIWNTGTQLGTALSLPILTTVAAVRTEALLNAGTLTDAAATVGGFRFAFLGALGLCLMGLIGIYVLRDNRSADSIPVEGVG